MNERRVVTCVCILLIALAGAVVVITFDLHHNLSDSDATVKHLDDFVSDATIDYAMKMEAVNHIINAAGVASEQAAMLAIEQRTQLRKTSLDSDKSVKALRLVIDRAGLLMKHTDEQLNGNSLPSITQAAVTNMNAIGENAAAIGDSARTLTAVMSDPKTQEILANLDNASGHFNVISENSEAMSNDMKIKVHSMVQPPSKWHTFLDVSWTAAKFGSLVVP
jgi:hypothetical protein